MPATFNKDEILLLNRRAYNNTRARFEDGIDWEHWRFIPGDGTSAQRFTDGHDYAGHDPSPWEGWELDEPVVLTPETVRTLLTSLREIQWDLDKAVYPPKRADRLAGAGKISTLLRTVKGLLWAK